MQTAAAHEYTAEQERTDLVELLGDMVRLFDTGAATLTPGPTLPSPQAIIDCARQIHARAARA